MSGLSDFMELEVLKLRLGKAMASTLPLTPYMALWTTLPADDGTGGVEVSGGSYSRKAMTSAFPTPTGAGGTVSNSGIIDFGTTTAAWGTIAGATSMTASSGGNIIDFYDVPSTTIANGQPVSFPVGSVTLNQS